MGLALKEEQKNTKQFTFHFLLFHCRGIFYEVYECAGGWKVLCVEENEEKEVKKHSETDAYDTENYFSVDEQ